MLCDKLADIHFLQNAVAPYVGVFFPSHLSSVCQSQFEEVFAAAAAAAGEEEKS